MCQEADSLAGRVQSSWQDLNEQEAGLAAWKQEFREEAHKDVRAQQAQLDERTLHLHELEARLAQQQAAQQVRVDAGSDQAQHLLSTWQTFGSAGQSFYQ